MFDDVWKNGSGLDDASEPNERSTKEVNLCTLYGDHDACPLKEVDERGNVLICNCACHSFPEAAE